MTDESRALSGLPVNAEHPVKDSSEDESLPKRDDGVSRIMGSAFGLFIGWVFALGAIANSLGVSDDRMSNEVVLAWFTAATALALGPPAVGCIVLLRRWCRAVGVTWSGYVACVIRFLFDSITLLSPTIDRAPAGCVLRGFSSGRGSSIRADLTAVRADRPVVKLTVVAHSSGSAVAALALASKPELRVHSFVTLGSAGIPSDVPDAAATNVQHMYAAQADERFGVAAFGRRRCRPHRADPTEGFGASVLETDGSSTVNVHDPTASPDPDDVGYLDADTKTLFETAEATLP